MNEEPSEERHLCCMKCSSSIILETPRHNALLVEYDSVPLHSTVVCISDFLARCAVTAVEIWSLEILNNRQVFSCGLVRVTETEVTLLGGG